MEKIDCMLLVDDDQTTNYVNQLLIEELGITQKLLIALNGLEALEIIQKHCQESQRFPSVILLDINMPVMNGFEFIKAYEQLDFMQKQAVIIVMLTTSLNPKDVERVKALGVTRYLNIPLSEEALKELVKEYVSLTR